MVVTPQAIIITVPSVGGEDVSNCDTSQSYQAIPNRKRRLSHLSFEEKIHRKKLKNRVAAQTSRDKKKARMEELEGTVAQLSAQVDRLSAESVTLRLQNSTLNSENESLKKQLKDAQSTTAALLESLKEKKCGCITSSLNNTMVNGNDLSSSSSRPAESLKLPLQKGMDGRQACLRIVQTMLMTAYLLSQTSSQTWEPKISQTCAIWNAWQKASCKMPLRLREKSRSLERLNKWWGKHQKTWNPVDWVVAPASS